MKKLILAALLVGTAGTANAASLINEDFQSGGFGVFTASGQVINANAQTYNPCCGVTGDPANRFAAFGGGNQPSGSLISATFATVAGKLYTLAFDYGAFGVGSETLSYLIDGAPSGGVVATADNNADTTFSSANFSFIGTGSSTTLSFMSGGIDNVDALLDNVSISSVPEPTTWAMLIGGMGAIGGSLRRRRQQVRVTYA